MVSTTDPPCPAGINFQNHFYQNRIVLWQKDVLINLSPLYCTWIQLVGHGSLCLPKPWENGQPLVISLKSGSSTKYYKEWKLTRKLGLFSATVNASFSIGWFHYKPRKARPRCVRHDVTKSAVKPIKFPSKNVQLKMVKVLVRHWM